MSQSNFEVILDTAVFEHFRALDRKYHGVVLDAIEQQLVHEPITPTRNRKPLRIPNTLNATWELRCGPNNRFRVFYDVDNESRTVVVLAVGRKARTALWIGGEKIEL